MREEKKTSLDKDNGFRLLVPRQFLLRLHLSSILFGVALH